MTRSFFVTMLLRSILLPSPRSLPSSEARPRLDFSDTFSQTFTRQLLLLLLPPPPPPPLPLPRSNSIERLSQLSRNISVQYLWNITLRRIAQFQKGSVVVISPPRLSQVATLDVATSHCLRLRAQEAVGVPKDSCVCWLRDRGASSTTEDGRTDGRTC